jgi:hypothetical protein
MTKKVLVLVMVSFLLLTGCKDKNDELFTKEESIVKEELKSANNITEETIKEKYLYLKDNFSSYDKSKKEDFIYNAKFIQTIGTKEDNELVKLADLILVFVKDSSKDNKEKVQIMFKNIETKENTLVNNLYVTYLTNNKIKAIINAKQDQVKADLKDKKILTSKYLKDGINYIEKNIKDPFKNDEVTENLVYYAMLFDGIGKKGNIKNLGHKTIAYLKTLDDSKYKEVTNILNKIDKDKDIKKALGN